MRKAYIFLFNALFLTVGISQAYSSLADCSLIGYTDCSNNHECDTMSIFTPNGDQYIQTDILKPEQGLRFWFTPNGEPNQRYTVSPNGKYIEVAEEPIIVPTVEPQGIELLIWIHIFDITDGFKYVNAVPNVLAGYGSMWSNDGTRFVVNDAWGQYLPYLVDITQRMGFKLWPPAKPLRTIRALSIAWSPNDSLIAVIGDEHPFPVTQQAQNDVQALYILQPSTTTYTPISNPQQTVDWFGSTIVWVTDQQLAYSARHINPETNGFENPSLDVVTVEGNSILSIPGQYYLYSQESNHELLVGHPAEDNIFQLLILDTNIGQFSHLIDLPIDKVTPFPYFNIAPNHLSISYLDPTGRQLHVQNFNNHWQDQLPAPVEESVGWWTPDSQRLLFFDYVKNVVHVYDLAGQKLTSKTASEMFPGQNKLPMYPNWICQS